MGEVSNLILFQTAPSKRKFPLSSNIQSKYDVHFDETTAHQIVQINSFCQG